MKFIEAPQVVLLNHNYEHIICRNTTVSHFCVVHYAGIVQYNIDGWVEKNKDAVERSGLEVLSESTKPIMKALFPKSMEIIDLL